MLSAQGKTKVNSPQEIDFNMDDTYSAHNEHDAVRESDDGNMSLAANSTFKIQSKNKKKQKLPQKQKPPKNGKYAQTSSHERVLKKVLDRNFPCGKCGKAFTRMEHLTRHERIHLNLKPYKCGNCMMEFSRKDLLKRHADMDHDGDIGDDAMFKDDKKQYNLKKYQRIYCNKESNIKRMEKKKQQKKMPKKKFDKQVLDDAADLNNLENIENLENIRSNIKFDGKKHQPHDKNATCTPKKNLQIQHNTKKFNSNNEPGEMVKYMQSDELKTLIKECNKFEPHDKVSKFPCEVVLPLAPVITKLEVPSITFNMCPNGDPTNCQSPNSFLIQDTSRDFHFHEDINSSFNLENQKPCNERIDNNYNIPRGCSVPLESKNIPIPFAKKIIEPLIYTKNKNTLIEKNSVNLKENSSSATNLMDCNYIYDGAVQYCYGSRTNSNKKHFASYEEKIEFPGMNENFESLSFTNKENADYIERSKKKRKSKCESAGNCGNKDDDDDDDDDDNDNNDNNNNDDDNDDDGIYSPDNKLDCTSVFIDSSEIILDVVIDYDTPENENFQTGSTSNTKIDKPNGSTFQTCSSSFSSRGLSNQENETFFNNTEHTFSNLVSLCDAPTHHFQNGNSNANFLVKVCLKSQTDV